MLQIFVYALAVAAALSLVGLAEARLAMMRDMPRRFFWVLAMVLSIAWPLGLLLWNRPAPVAVLQEPAAFAQPQAAPIALPEGQGTAPASANTAPVETAATLAAVTPSDSPVPDRMLLAAWAVLTSALLLYLVGAALTLARRASRWTQAEVQGR